MPRILALLVLIAPVLAGQDDVFEIGRRIDAVPTPRGFLGNPLGRRHTSTHEAIAYARAIADASDRVTVTTLGRPGKPSRTDTGLPLVRVIVTAAGRDVGEVETTSRRRRSDAGSLPQDHPVTAWFTMSIHGDEASGVEAGLAILYHLAASNDDATVRILENVVLHLELVCNPDGRERFVQGVRDRKSRGGARRDRRAWDHVQPWPGGRTNHYLFDLNRDWFLQTQTESRIRVDTLNRVVPQVLCDFHEMGTDSTYYFSAPPAMPTNHHFTAEVRSSQKAIGDAIGRWFDSRGWPYWTGDTFPADYPGYGGSWPCLLGAAGFTFEQASARAGAVPRLDGSLHSLRESTERHAGAGMAVLDHCARNRARVLNDWTAHFARVRKDAADDSKPWFVFTPRHDPRLQERLGLTLRRNDIDVRRLTRPLTLDCSPLAGGANAPRTVPAGTLLVTTRQPLRPLLLALCDPEVLPEEAFLKAETRRRANRQRSEVYDVSAWNLPLLFGVESFRATSLPAGVEHSPFAVDPDARVAPVDPDAVAWLESGRSVDAATRLTALLERGVRVRHVPFAFTIEGKTFEPGTLLVLKDRNDPETITRHLAAIGGSRPMIGVKTLATSEGFDLGSGRTRPIKKPEIVVLTGEGTSAYSAGSVWWFLERPFQIRHTRVGRSQLSLALEHANVLVIPDGRHADLEKTTVESFLARGGTVVSLRGGTRKLVDLALLPLERTEGASKLGSVAGVISRTTLDATHWLSHGVSSAPPVQVRTSDYWIAGDAITKVLACAPADRLHLSGILTGKQREAVAGSPLIVEHAVGRGRIIAFTEDPTFRGTTPGLWRFFLNSILVGPSRP